MAFAANAACNQTREPSVRTDTALALDTGVTARIISFDNLSDGKEHVALSFPAHQADQTPLVRIHSECLTGDALGSAQCDCGDQLREAKEKMSAQGGILLYLRQEGRGIGLYNKLDAYRLQQEGLDTFAANRHLGFAEDERSFRVAAEMLQAMGIGKIRLLTNNPDKVAQLQMNGIEIEDVIPTGRYEKNANRHYLQTKRDHGHTL